MKYFGKVRRLLNLISSLDLDNIVYNITLRSETRQLIIELNTREQLFEGINSDGEDLESIGGSYAPFTIAIKQSDGLPSDRVTLFQSGDFYDTFEIKPYRGGFDIIADTDKDDGDLRFRWGNEIIGLTEESKQDLANYYRNEIIKEIRKKIRNV